MKRSRALEDIPERERRWMLRGGYDGATHAMFVSDGHGTWPRNVSACHDPGRSCQFVPLCVGEPGASHQFVTRPVREEAKVA